MGISELSVAHGVLVAMGCWGSYVTCGGLLSSIDNALSRRFCRFCDSAVAAADACGLAGVIFVTMSAAFFQLDAFIVLNVPLYKYKIANAQ